MDICLLYSFWDDFKYTVIQMSFNIDLPIEKNEEFIEDIESLYQTYNDSGEKNCRCFNILDSYFLRGIMIIQKVCYFEFFLILKCI